MPMRSQPTSCMTEVWLPSNRYLVVISNVLGRARWGLCALRFRRPAGCLVGLVGAWLGGGRSVRVGRLLVLVLACGLFHTPVALQRRMVPFWWRVASTVMCRSGTDFQ